MPTTRTLISDALRKIGVVAQDEQATAHQISHAVRAYNRFVQAMQNRGLDLFTVAGMSVSLTTAAAYDLDPKPFEIRTARLKRGGIETPLQRLTREEYDRISQKASNGMPTSFYYNRHPAQMIIWPVPAVAAGQTIELTYTRELDEADLNEEPDWPGEFEDAVIYGLAARLADDYMVNAPLVLARAEEEIRLALASDREGSVFFAGPYA